MNNYFIVGDIVRIISVDFMDIERRISIGDTGEVFSINNNSVGIKLHEMCFLTKNKLYFMTRCQLERL